MYAIQFLIETDKKCEGGYRLFWSARWIG